MSMKIRKIVIPAADLVDGHTVYFVEVFIKEYSWLIRKRYREFHELHEKLIKRHGVPVTSLPPKKIFGNLDADHVEKRRQALEVYLQVLIEKFREALPEELNHFLEGHKYDVCGVTYTLAQELFNKGEEILTHEELYTMTPLQLYCITKRLELPAPTCDSHVDHGEIGNLYDFIQLLKHLKISAKSKQIELSENVNFKFDLSLFKSLLSLEISSCDVEPFQGICQLQNQLVSLVVQNSIHLLKDILVDDEIWEQGILECVSVDGATSLSPITNYSTWKVLKYADFSKNELPYIDDSVALLPNVEKLNLSYNYIESIEHLQDLSKLVNLDLSHNMIESLGENLNAKLGNVKQLNLSANQLIHVDGLEKLYSLVELDLSANKLSEVVSVLLLGQLPCLEILLLVGNPMTKENMYRVRVLSSFDERADQVLLDEHKATPREIKKVNDILHEEQSFEIVDLPQAVSGTPIKTKPGHRKMKSIDRVIQLEESSSKSSCLTDSMSLVDESDLEFRSRVEKIRQLGGDTWLTMLGDITQIQDTTQSSTGTANDTELHPNTNIPHESPDRYCADSQDSGVKSLTSEGASRDSEMFVAKVAGVEPGGTGTGLPRLHFGFTCELEELVRNKLDTDTHITSGTYMVEVEIKAGQAAQYEERMVGVDLSKGVILEIQIANGKTCAKHQLEDVSSVDILDIQGSFHIDIRDMYSKEWRRHRTSSNESRIGQQKDYRHVARYRMRSMADAAELFVLLYKFITKSCESYSVQSKSTKNASDLKPNSSRIWKNFLGFPEEMLEKLFQNFLERGKTTDISSTADQSCHDGKDRVRSSGIHSGYHALHADFIGAGTLKHDGSRVEEESVRMALWVGCLPYLFPEQEIPVCLVLTDVNIFLFHIVLASLPSLKSQLSYEDLQQVMHCFYSMPIRALKQVVVGLYDQGFRLEVRNDGARGTFTFLTRDSDKTRVFLERLYETLGESSDDDNSLLHRRVSFDSRSNSVPSFSYPDERKVSQLKESLFGAVGDDSVKNQDLLMYSILRQLPESTLSNEYEAGILTKRLRSLIVMNSRIFLCDEDHVHWPLPTFVRAQPSTPQWVVSNWQELDKMIGIDMFELDNSSEFVGVFGLSLIFDDSDSVSEEVESMASETHKSICWNLIFRSSDEREQLQRSLAQVWKDHFEADLKVTHSKPRSLPHPPEKHNPDLLGFRDSLSSSKPITPVGTPVDQSSFQKSHRRVGSDSLPLFKATTPDCLESLVALDRKTLDRYFNKLLALRPDGQDEKLLHVLWTGCTPYLFPSKEIQVCVLLTNLVMYILADTKDEQLISKKKSVNLPGSSKADANKAICFTYIPTSRLHQVCVGLFDQTVRVEGTSREETFTLITRDFNLTNAFLECLNAVLSSKAPTSSTPTVPNTFTSSDKADSVLDTCTSSIYDTQTSNKTDSVLDTCTSSIYDTQTSDKTDDKQTSDKTDSVTDTCTSSIYDTQSADKTDSTVKFVYPSDDSVEILKDVIAKFSQDSDLCSSIYDVTILVYLLVFHASDSGFDEPRTLIIMDKALCLCLEDHVHYPLTLFAMGLPDNPQYRIWDVRDVETLSRIEFTDFNSCDFTLVFSPSAPECENDHEDFDSASMGELCVITHYTADEIRESTWRVIAPTYEEKEKSLSLICKLWCDIRGEALPVMKARES